MTSTLSNSAWSNSADQWALEPVDCERSEWTDLLSRVPHLVFHEPAWARVLATGFQTEVFCFVIRLSGEVVGGALGLRLQRAGISLGQFGLHYGGMIGQAPPGAVLAALLRDYGRAQGLIEVRLVGFPGENCVVPAGAIVQEDQTQILDLTDADEDALQAGYHTNIRRNLLRAERAGVEIRQVNTIQGADTLYALFQAAMRIKRAPVKYPAAYLRSLVSELEPLGCVRCLLAYHQDRPVGGTLVVDSDQMTHFLFNGSLPEARQHRPNEALMHTHILRALERGQQQFDFLPSGIDNAGVVRFKEKWGPRPVPIQHRFLGVYPLRSRLLRWGLTVSQWGPVRRIAGRLLHGR